MAAWDAYIICTSPRSGSTLLCRLLKATGVAGAPGSHFHEPDLHAWCADYGLDPGPAAAPADTIRAVLAAAVRKGRGAGDVFGLRLQRGSAPFFLEQLGHVFPEASGDLDSLQAAFGRVRFIHLTREDKLAQAISYVKAGQTGLWHKAPDGTEIERLSAPADPVYDPTAIAAEMARMTAYDQAWRDWFAATGIAPIPLRYSDLSRDPVAALARVLEALGLDPAAARVPVPTAKLADGINADWYRRFRLDHAAAQTP